MKRAFHKKEKPIVADESGKFRLFSPGQLEKYETAQVKSHETGYRLLSPQSLLKIHSQYEWLTWLRPEEDDEEHTVEISSAAATELGIDELEKVEIFNEHGKVVRHVKINPLLPAHTILAKQAGQHPINQLIKEDEKREQEASNYFYDSLVSIRKWRE